MYELTPSKLNQPKGEGIMHTIKIYVKDGVVYEVDNLPDGFQYEIIDEDINQEEKEKTMIWKIKQQYLIKGRKKRLHETFDKDTDYDLFHKHNGRIVVHFGTKII
jgi:hypothetical protein